MAKKEEVQGYDNIIAAPIVDEMKESFLAYSMSVITSRALPDVRDGLKPVHRRILYSMHKNGLHAGARFKKSATIVGDVLGKYHPHGDTAVYDSMVNTAQTFSYRYPLVLGQGNFGSIDGDAAAAYRYTEAKMSKIAGEMLNDIEKETVDFRPNFDGSTQEPVVLPAALPNVLLNGTLGIAVGMATNIPPHHLGEVIDATVALIEDGSKTNEDLMKYVKGPDFPMGGIIYNKKDIARAYATGRGGIVTRGEARIEEGKRGSFHIIITSIPFRVNKSNLIIKIADLVRDKKIKGIKDLRDESTSDIRVVIELKPEVNPNRILNYLYKHTDLETNFNFNLVALVNGVPQTLSLKDMLVNFIEHRREVIKRRAEFELRKAEARAHILEGLKKALDNIDEVIKTIKSSKDTPTAKLNLIKKFRFSDIQAQAILDMRLQKLAGLERKKIEDELAAVLKLITELKTLLKSTEKMLAVVKDELLVLKEKYNDERRTRVVAQGVKEISDEDLVQEKESALVFTAGGYVKRTDPDEYKAQKRGGVGVVDMETKEEDVVTHLLVTSTKSDLLFFTTLGKVYQIKMYDIPEGRRATKGKSIMNFLQLEGEERVTSILAIPKEDQQKDFAFFFVTQQGVVKKVAADQFKNVRRSGLIALNLKKGDLLHAVKLVNENEDIMLFTQQGQSVRFKSSDVRVMGRSAAGIKGISLKKADEVVGLGVVEEGKGNVNVLVVSEHGFGKRTALEEYKVQNRGGSGIKTVQLTEKTGKLVGGSACLRH
jgi:DNA gyrase subunit A